MPNNQEADMRDRVIGPVVIGGVGGSGTRVVAQMLIEMDFYMGSDLNQACDNLWCTFLFRRARWLTHRANNDEELVFKSLDILTKAMTTGLFPPGPSEFAFIARSMARSMRADQRTARRMGWVLRRAWGMLYSRGMDISEHVGWGWKEPNTHIYLGYMDRHFQDLKYVHVVRHGLDMAYSKNRLQFKRWGGFFGITAPPAAELLPRAALQYWIQANRRAVALGERMGRDRFLLVRFDELCASPRAEVERIVAFLGLTAGDLDMDRLCSIPRTPDSIGRYKKHDLSIFTAAELDAVREFGFKVEA